MASMTDNELREFAEVMASMTDNELREFAEALWRSYRSTTSYADTDDRRSFRAGVAWAVLVLELESRRDRAHEPG